MTAPAIAPVSERDPIRPVGILALDPGPTETGYCYYVPEAAPSLRISSGVLPNEAILSRVAALGPYQLAIEMIASYGMPVGREVFETCVWIGRFVQAARDPEAVQLVYRRDVKMHLCSSNKAKDANLWQALVDRFGPPGTKHAPGPLYGVRSHARAALALAVTVADQKGVGV